jgi:hypothetical protein
MSEEVVEPAMVLEEPAILLEELEEVEAATAALLASVALEEPEGEEVAAAAAGKPRAQSTKASNLGTVRLHDMASD